MWATPEGLNNVHPQLGGLHTIMSSSAFDGVDAMLSGKTFR